MRAVNLLPREAVRERRGIPSVVPLAAAIAVPVIAVSLVLVGYSSAHSAVTVERGQLDALRAQGAVVGPVVAPAVVSSSAELATQRTQRLAALQDALGKRVAWDVTLNDIARVLPATVWLSGMTLASPTPADVAPPAPPAASTTTTTTTTTTTPAPAPAAPPTPTGFTMSGFAYTEDDVALLLQRLQLLPSLKEVTLDSSAEATVGTKSVVQFQIAATVQAAGPQ